MTLALGAHLLEVAVFAIGWYLLLQNGSVELMHFNRGVFEPTPMDVFYFSGEVYTSLGFGDIVPGQGGQLLAVSEAVTGLVLIAWTASYTFFLMARHWSDARGSTSGFDNR